MRKVTHVLWFVSPMIVVACDDHSHGEHGHEVPVEVRFAAKVGAEDFACSKTFTGVGTSTEAVTIEPLDFRFYVHDVRLTDGEGREWPIVLEQDRLWQTDDLALLDFEDKTAGCSNGTVETNTSVRGTVDTGHEEVAFKGVRFTLGVPFEMNHQDVAVAASPLNLSGLFWNWNAGYKFVRIDTKVVTAANPAGSGRNLHIGSTECVVGEGTTAIASCGAPNRAEIALNDFDPETNTIVIDFAAIVADLDLAVDQGAAPGCMSGKDDPECTSIFDHLGIDITTGMPKAGQDAFRVE